MILDPFFGVFDWGMKITRWMNRILLVLEICVFTQLAIHIDYNWAPDPWVWALTPFFLIIFVSIVNMMARWIWNIVMVIIYGTTDADALIKAYDDRCRKKAAKAAAKAEKKARKAARNQIREQLPVRETPRLREPAPCNVDYGEKVYVPKVGDHL